MTSAKYDVELEKQIQQWMESVLEEPFPEGQTFAEALKDGQRLCRFINRIKPESVKKIETSGMMFKQMENISKFLAACRAVGVPSFECFETNDLFQEKNMAGVLRCLDALGRTVQRTVPEFQGPHFGVKMASENRRQFDPEVLKRGVAVTKLNMGSATTMERRGFDISNSVNFGNAYVGASKCDAPTFLTTGDATVKNPLGIDAVTMASPKSPTAAAAASTSTASSAASSASGSAAAVPVTEPPLPASSD